MQSEVSLHEGTWLIWPHPYTYGLAYQREIEAIWVQMTKALHVGEKVHLIAYDESEERRIRKLLMKEKVEVRQIDFLIAKSDDIWIRDTGPMFAFDEKHTLTILDFGFNGWGEKVAYKNDNKIPKVVSQQTNIQRVDASHFILEGGSIELDGNGTLMATKSSVISEHRNKELSIAQAENYFSQYLGVKNFIWLEGVMGEDITDAHIDGIARFLDDQTILTVSKEDFMQLYENINVADYEQLTNAKNIEGNPYVLTELPLTQNHVQGLDYQGSYLNFYVGNQVVLVPIYEDPNDALALEIIKKAYPDRNIVPIVVNQLYKYGGMIHCVTQQQPLGNNF